MTEPALAFNVRGRGRHYRHPVTGEEVPSVTNVIGVLDKPALPRWAAKVVAEQAWLLRGTLDKLGRDEAVDVLKGAPWRKSTRAADRGTTIHDYLHARAQGVEPPELEGDAARYQKAADQFLDDYQPEFLYTEATVFGDGYAGTFDFMAVIDGVTVLGDYKTSKDLYPEIALQLAAIRNASEIVVDGELHPMPSVERCVGVLLTASKCDVREVDTGGAYEAFRACLGAWHWQKAGVSMTQWRWT